MTREPNIAERLRDIYATHPMVMEAADEVERLELENQLLFDHVKGNDADLEMFNKALRAALEPKP